MRCPHCGNCDDKVMESRTLAQGDCIRRRRECLACGYRFTSYEHIEEKPFMVIKKDGRREPFDRKKLEKGIERALEKRPVSLNSIENIVTEIEDQAILSSGLNKEIERLKDFDEVAYIRFASVYKQFSNLDEFVNEVKKVRK